jgi:hypothetical protein
MSWVGIDQSIDHFQDGQTCKFEWTSKWVGLQSKEVYIDSPLIMFHCMKDDFEVWNHLQQWDSNIWETPLLWFYINTLAVSWMVLWLWSSKVTQTSLQGTMNLVYIKSIIQMVSLRGEIVKKFL